MLASALCAGVVALILQGNPTASPDEVDKILAQASVDIWFNSASTIQPTSSTTNFLQAINLPKACTDTPPDSRYTCAQQVRPLDVQVGWESAHVRFVSGCTALLLSAGWLGQVWGRVYAGQVQPLVRPLLNASAPLHSRLLAFHRILLRSNGAGKF